MPQQLADQERALARSRRITAIEIPFAKEGVKLLDTESGTPIKERVKLDRHDRAAMQELSAVKAVSILKATPFLNQPMEEALMLFSRNLDRNWPRVEDFNHACSIAEAALPDSWKQGWQQRGPALRTQIRSFAFELSMRMNVYDRPFGEQIGFEMLAMLGLIKR